MSLFYIKFSIVLIVITLSVGIRATNLTNDFDGDGKTDLLFEQTIKAMNIGSNGYRQIWRSTGNGFSVDLNPGQAQGLFLDYYPKYADFNGDGKSDILWERTDAYGRSKGKRQIWISLANGSFTKVTNPSNQNGYYIGWRSLIADFNGDGLADIFWYLSDVFGRSRGSHTLWLGRGDGGFSVTHNIMNSNGNYLAWKPIARDLNGDNKVDLVWDLADANGRSRGYRIIWAGKNDGFLRVNSYSLGTADGYYVKWKMSFGDFNGDDKSDILWDAVDGHGRSKGYRILWLSNSSDFEWDKYTNLKGSDGYYVNWKSLIGDFNGDGRDDILWDNQDVFGRSLGTRHIWRTSGAAQFTVDYNPTNGNGYYKGWSPYVGDFDNSGSSDILWSAEDEAGVNIGTIGIWYSRTHESFVSKFFTLGSNYKLRTGSQKVASGFQDHFFSFSNSLVKQSNIIQGIGTGHVGPTINARYLYTDASVLSAPKSSTLHNPMNNIVSSSHAPQNCSPGPHKLPSSNGTLSDAFPWYDIYNDRIQVRFKSHLITWKYDFENRGALILESSSGSSQSFGFAFLSKKHQQSSSSISFQHTLHASYSGHFDQKIINANWNGLWIKHFLGFSKEHFTHFSNPNVFSRSSFVNNSHALYSHHSFLTNHPNSLSPQVIFENYGHEYGNNFCYGDTESGHTRVLLGLKLNDKIERFLILESSFNGNGKIPILGTGRLLNNK